MNFFDERKSDWINVIGIVTLMITAILVFLDWLEIAALLLLIVVGIGIPLVELGFWLKFRRKANAGI